jgi:hypothetical protein
VNDVIPELVGTYPYVPHEKPAGLPDVVGELTTVELEADGGSIFPYYQLQQRAVIVFTVDLSIMVNNENPQTAAQQLRDFEQRLRTDLAAEPNLRGSVPFRSPRCSADFTPPFVEYEDGTKGREMTFTVTVGDLAEVQNG